MAAIKSAVKRGLEIAAKHDAVATWMEALYIGSSLNEDASRDFTDEDMLLGVEDAFPGFQERAKEVFFSPMRMMRQNVSYDDISDKAEKIYYRDQYLKDIRSWDWEGLKSDALENEGQVWLGTVYSLTPSGEFYTAWASLADEDEVDEDILWWEAMDIIAESHGMSVSNGEMEPDHLYAFVDGVYVSE